MMRIRILLRSYGQHMRAIVESLRLYLRHVDSWKNMQEGLLVVS